MYGYNYNKLGYQCLCCCPENTILATQIQGYIKDELRDSKYYEILAEKAPDQMAKNLLLGFSNDEKSHAQNFNQAYNLLTGNMIDLPQVEAPLVPEYKRALRERIIAETNDYVKYGQQYLVACSKYIQSLFFMVRTDEATHAMRIPILLV